MNDSRESQPECSPARAHRIDTRQARGKRVGNGLVNGIPWAKLIRRLGSPVSWAKLVRLLCSPQIWVRQIIRQLSIGSLDFRLSLLALDRAQYAFGVKQAIFLASKLGHRSVSVIEFGVGTGSGLRLLETYAAKLGRRAGIQVEVYGFDTGSGLPAPSDYRDLGYIWKRGQYQMDVAGLRAKLKSAKLVLGDVRETVPEFLRSQHAPIGFISFDLDYYSSTRASFEVFTASDRAMLPRILCYFDDVASDGHQLHCEYTGELLAIREFNQGGNGSYTLAPIGVLNENLLFPLLFPAVWTQQLWVYHRFQHPEYNTYVGF